MFWLKIISIPHRLMAFSCNSALYWWDWESGGLRYSGGGVHLQLCFTKDSTAKALKIDVTAGKIKIPAAVSMHGRKVTQTGLELRTKE